MTERKTRHEAATPRLSRDSLHLAKEVRSIQRRAADHDGRIVTIGPLVFFSTETGDAWMLEPAGHLASRLATDGDPLPVHIEETETRYAIGWQGRYRIEGQMFIYEDNCSHRLTAIQGYPVQRLLHAIDEAKGH
ncbi:hypothetical protein AWB78_08465 [Caballeronia calidae]|uniref:Uncharacterized protein n=1 Tax=Caballeronia calidae TaxID=1777139 RepID=A0A158EJX5_9BURK|nr:hypothetical protein [Caballeronia calidae]SAL07192.1 hypothetical protein AWB78_08465 [Caballeronia calidae]